MEYVASSKRKAIFATVPWPTSYSRKYNFDYVVNFAAESLVDQSIENPQLFLQTNILGTQNLLDAARKAWVTGKAGENGYRYGVKVYVSIKSLPMRSMEA